MDCALTNNIQLPWPYEKPCLHPQFAVVLIDDAPNSLSFHFIVALDDSQVYTET